jgi:hypothetical protein
VLKGKLGGVITCPLGSLTVPRALNVVCLISDHLADERDQLIHRLPGRTYIFSADGEMIDIGMEHRSEHHALGHFLGKIRAHHDLRTMNLSYVDAVFLLDESLDAVFNRIPVRRITCRLHDPDARVVFEQEPQPLIFRL